MAAKCIPLVGLRNDELLYALLFSMLPFHFVTFYIFSIFIFDHILCYACFTAACANYAADIVFVVDSSGSIRDQNPADNSYDNWNLILQYVYDVVDLMPIGSNNVRVGLVVYSQYGINAFRLNT